VPEIGVRPGSPGVAHPSGRPVRPSAPDRADPDERRTAAEGPFGGTDTHGVTQVNPLLGRMITSTISCNAIS
jgi:hypothetical protein